MDSLGFIRRLDADNNDDVCPNMSPDGPIWLRWGDDDLVSVEN